MKMTVEKIREIINQDEAKRAAARAEVEDLNRKLATLENESQAAVESGNVEAYYQKLQEKEKTAATLHVKQVFLDKISTGMPVSEASAREAWENYASPYNKKLNKAMVDFKAKRDELNAMYSAMVDLQQKACETREFLAEAAGVSDKVKSFKMECLPAMPTRNIGWSEDPGLIAISGCSCADPDAVYYLACYEQNHNRRIGTASGYKMPEEAVRIQLVVGDQKSV